MKVFTIGFSRKNTEQFFTRLREPGLLRVVDIRLYNKGPSAGFTNRNDLPFLLRQVNQMDYVHRLDMAPNEALMDDQRTNGVDYLKYKKEFRELLTDRRIETNVPKELIDGGCLLCSEPSAEFCHRRLVAEYLKEKWGDLEIIHL